MTSHVVHLGDGLEGLRGLADGSVSAVVTDPPYSERTHAGQRHGRVGKSKNADAWVTRAGLGYDHLTPEQVKALGQEFARVAKGWVLVMTSHDLFPLWESALGRYTFPPIPVVMPGMNVRLSGDGPSSWTVWLVVNRPKGLIDGTRPGAYIATPGQGPDRAANPVKGSKPLGVMEAILRDYTRQGDTVCDPFTGSGTTGVACKRLGRSFVGWEIAEATHAYAEKRIAAAREQLGLWTGAA